MQAIDEFRAEARAWLEANAEPRREVKLRWGEGPDTVALLPEHTPEEDAAEVAEAKTWRAKVYDAGFAWVSGPVEYGGRGLTKEHERAWMALEAGFQHPSNAPFGIGLGMVAPTVLAHAQENVKSLVLPAMYRGDIIGCQLFSEPGAGSDLAGIQAWAVLDGDEWVLNGQKVWTSHAQHADIGEIITRTSPVNGSRHQGMTMFLIDMHAPGVEVRPLRQMTGGASFNEVFLTDVRAPADRVLGDVGAGWGVALTTLMNERMAIGGGSIDVDRGMKARLFELARQTGASADPAVRQHLAGVHINTAVARYTTMRAVAKLQAAEHEGDRQPGPELSILKLALTNNLQRMAEAATAILGPSLMADSGEWGTYAWKDFVLGVPGFRLAGGTDEVMRNIVAERALGLPKG